MSIVQLLCPQCGEPDLDTIEMLKGVAGTKNGIAKNTETGWLVIDWVGETDVNWDASTTVGFVCRVCGFEVVDETGEEWPWPISNTQNPIAITAADVEQVDPGRHSA